MKAKREIFRLIMRSLEVPNQRLKVKPDEFRVLCLSAE